jgi:hypothetical protein
LAPHFLSKEGEGEKTVEMMKNQIAHERTTGFDFIEMVSPTPLAYDTATRTCWLRYQTPLCSSLPCGRVQEGWLSAIADHTCNMIWKPSLRYMSSIEIKTSYFVPVARTANIYCMVRIVNEVGDHAWAETDVFYSDVKSDSIEELWAAVQTYTHTHTHTHTNTHTHTHTHT